MSLKLTFVTAQELDPLTASFLNTRFVAFLARFSQELGKDITETAPIAAQILREADIPQDGDNLLSKNDNIDLSPFTTL